MYSSTQTVAINLLFWVCSLQLHEIWQFYENKIKSALRRYERFCTYSYLYSTRIYCCKQSPLYVQYCILIKFVQVIKKFLFVAKLHLSFGLPILIPRLIRDGYSLHCMYVDFTLHACVTINAMQYLQNASVSKISIR